MSVLLLIMLGATPKIGDTAPDFVVTDTDGRVHRLTHMLREGPVVVAFFPQAFTPDWTKELTAYRSRYGELQGAEVIAISTDPPWTQTKFKRVLRAQFPFVADVDGTLTRLFEVRHPNLLVAKRRTFVIRPDRRIVYVGADEDAVDPTGAVDAVASLRDDLMPRW